MAGPVKAIDIRNEPMLLRLAEEVRSSNEPLVLRRDHEDVAIPVPAKRARRRTRGEKTPADYEAFLLADGGWKDVDSDKLIADIYADRARGDRPSVEL